MKKQTTMPALNEVLARLQEFAEEKGNWSELARPIGKNPAIFYNLVRRNAKPSVETLEEIAGAFPDFDLNYIITGERRGVDQVELEDRAETIQGLQEEVAHLRGQNRFLTKTIETMNALLGKPKDTTSALEVDRLYGHILFSNVVRTDWNDVSFRMN
jgi:hypothetical protein